MKMNIIVLGMIKRTSFVKILAQAKKISTQTYLRISGQSVMKIGFRGTTPYILGDSQEEAILIHLDDIEYILCFQGGEAKQKNIDQFFKMYKNLLV